MIYCSYREIISFIFVNIILLLIGRTGKFENLKEDENPSPEIIKLVSSI